MSSPLIHSPLSFSLTHILSVSVPAAMLGAALRRAPCGKELLCPARSAGGPETGQQPRERAWKVILPQSSPEMAAALADTSIAAFETLGQGTTSSVRIPEPQKLGDNMFVVLST